jgi:hypothetical protein
VERHKEKVGGVHLKLHCQLHNLRLGMSFSVMMFVYRE